jgi:hypothetical protein
LFKKRTVYDYDYDIVYNKKIDYNHTVTWLKFEQNILNEYGMPYIWYTHTFINSYWIVNVVKLSLKDKFKQSWHTSIQNSTKIFVLDVSRKH